MESGCEGDPVFGPLARLPDLCGVERQEGGREGGRASDSSVSCLSVCLFIYLFIITWNPDNRLIIDDDDDGKYSHVRKQ